MSAKHSADDARIREAIRKLHRKSDAIKGKPSDPYLRLESTPSSRDRLALFGAGHVGREIVRILAGSELDIMWIDPRTSEFPDTLPPNPTLEIQDAPAKFATSMPPCNKVLVLTHNHQLDLGICNAVLKLGDFDHFGLIGSRSKCTRFRNRLRELGHASGQTDRMICPIGSHRGSKMGPYILNYTKTPAIA